MGGFLQGLRGCVVNDVNPESLEFYAVPPDLEQAFARATTGVDIFLLRSMYRGLRGEPFNAGDERALSVAVRQLGINAETLTRLAPHYNKALIAHHLRGDVDQPEPPEGQVRFATRSMKPHALDRAIEAVVSNSIDRIITKRFFMALRGRALPAGEEADELRRRLQLSYEAYARTSTNYELALVYHQAGSKWRTYDHGHRRRKQSKDMLLVFPKAYALRLPIIYNVRNDEAIDGQDIWGKLHCSEALRPGSVAIIGYVLGIASHPGRYAKYGQIDSEGRVLTSKTRLYQTLAAINQVDEPGGGGQRLIDDYLAQLDRLQLRADVDDKRGIRGEDGVPEMAIFGPPFRLIEKCVDGEGENELLWVPLDDERPFTRHVQFPVRFTIDKNLRSRVGENGGPGDRVYLNPEVWRTLSPLGRALYFEVRGRTATRDEHARHAYVQWTATNKWSLRFGLDHLRHDHREKILLHGIAELRRVDERVISYSKPWHFYSNTKAKTYRVYLQTGAKSKVRPELMPQLRRADFLLQMLDSEDGSSWVGRASLTAPTNAPPNTS